MSDGRVVIYTPRVRYNSRTYFAAPLIAPFLRAAAIIGLEWTTLSYIEDAPRAVRVATFLVALAMLAVLQSKDWLNFKGKWYFAGSILGLLLIYLAVVGFAYWNFQMKPDGRASGDHPRVKTDVTRLLGELPALSDLLGRSSPLNIELSSFLRKQPLLIAATPPNLVEAETRATELENKFNALRNDYLTFFEKHGYDRNEPTSAVNWEDTYRQEQIGNIIVALGNYASELGRLPSSFTTSDVLRATDFLERYSNLRADSFSFGEWCAQANLHLNQKRAELQTALATAQ